MKVDNSLSLWCDHFLFPHKGSCVYFHAGAILLLGAVWSNRPIWADVWKSLYV